MVKKKVLLVSNGDLFREVEKSFFYRDQYELLFAGNGVAAYEMASEERPHLIFMDIVLPELSGDDCCRRLKAHEELRNIPVIMLASGDQAEELRRCERAGCDDILLKPLNWQLFMDSGRRYLRVGSQVSSQISPRVKMRFSVHYGVGNKERELREFSINISTGGLFIETVDPPPVETPLRLEFLLPGQERPIRCIGRVAWLNAEDGQQNPQLPKGMGVQFVDMSLEDMRLIRSLIMQQLLAPR